MKALSIRINVPFLRKPRNDTKSERFCLETGTLRFMQPFFCAVLLRIVFQTFRSGNRSISQQNLSDLSLRGGRNFAPDAAILNGTRRHPGTKHGKARAMIYSRRLYNGWYVSAYITQPKVEWHREAAALQYGRRALQTKQTPPELE